MKTIRLLFAVMAMICGLAACDKNDDEVTKTTGSSEDYPFVGKWGEDKEYLYILPETTSPSGYKFGWYVEYDGGDLGSVNIDVIRKLETTFHNYPIYELEVYGDGYPFWMTDTSRLIKMFCYDWIVLTDTGFIYTGMSRLELFQISLEQYLENWDNKEWWFNTFISILNKDVVINGVDVADKYPSHPTWWDYYINDDIIIVPWYYKI